MLCVALLPLNFPCIAQLSPLVRPPPLYNCILHHFGMRNAALALCGNLPPMDKSDLQMKHFHLRHPMAFNTVHAGYEWIQSVSYLFGNAQKKGGGGLGHRKKRIACDRDAHVYSGDEDNLLQ